MQEFFYESGNCVQIICAIQGVHPKSFSPTSVQFKGKINDALPRKRHQKRHLEFCTAYLLSRGSPVRGWPGAPLFWNSLKQYELDKTVFTRPSAFWTDGRRRQDSRVFPFSSIDPIAYVN